MPATRKQSRFKKWMSRLFTSENGTNQDLRCRTRLGSGILNGAKNFVVHSPTMMSVEGDNATVIHVQGSGAAQTIKFLSQHIIHGAAYNSSAREPPPRCLPGTRINIIAEITTWFNGQAQQELLLWITGPAGVGKSAIIQTFAEYLAECNLLGASVFISRPDKRDNPHDIFITIAYQLTTQIEAYRDFIVEKLSRDPECLNGDMQAQFTTFIIEPFVEKGIGAGQRWGVLLDGLDELKNDDAQCRIIELISTFVQEHRDSPLVWIIASRPESHISNTFEDDEVRGSYWSRYIPIDATEARDDVEHFLRSEFNTTLRKFRHSVPKNWPSNTDILKLTAAASGLFIYARVVMQFIRDQDLANPISRLGVVLSIIDRSNGISDGDNPFLHLDALYGAILSLVSPTHRPTARHVLGFTLYAREISYLGSHGMTPSGMVSFTRRNLHTLRGMSILFGIPLHDIYACLNKSRSTLRIPDWEDAHKECLTFLHVSFSDYLRDSSRSHDFYVGSVEDVADVVLWRLVEIWNKCSGDGGIATVESRWNEYCSKLDDQAQSKAITEFHASLFRDVVYFVGLAVYRISSMPADSPTYEQLGRVHMFKLCYYFNAYGLLHCVSEILKNSRNLEERGLLRKVRFEDLNLEHLDWKEMSPAHVRPKTAGFWNEGPLRWKLHRPGSEAKLKRFVSNLKSLRQRSPDLEIFIFGGVPSGRVAVFRRPMREKSTCLLDFMFYAIPYPE